MEKDVKVPEQARPESGRVYCSDCKWLRADGSWAPGHKCGHPNSVQYRDMFHERQYWYLPCAKRNPENDCADFEEKPPKRGFLCRLFCKERP